MREISWDDYYSRFFDWSPSTQKNYSYGLTDFGFSDEVLEIINEFALNDEAFAARFTEKAINAGVKFSPDQVLELTLLVDKRVLSRAAETASTRFNREQLEEIHMFIDDASFERISQKAQIDIFSDDEEDALDEETFEMEEYTDVPTRQERPGFFAALFGAFVGSGTNKKADTGRCNGDCDNCPAHYGYRYGRWYYGHGHQHGCQRGGNGGARGKTYRD